MSIATEILSLRRDRSSSVASLIAAMEWSYSAVGGQHFLARDYAAQEMADIVLLNVAVHATETMNAFSTPTTKRRSMRSQRSRPRFNGRHQGRIALPNSAA